jgi:hypothetical protein
MGDGVITGEVDPMLVTLVNPPLHAARKSGKVKSKMRNPIKLLSGFLPAKLTAGCPGLRRNNPLHGQSAFASL